MNTITENCIKTCNSLLRGEISAVETYDKVLEKHPDTPVIGEIQRIRDEHQSAVNLLTANVREMGGEPDNGSGAWGALTRAIQGTANLFGADSALESLQRGEEIGRRDYEDALRDEEMMPECRALVSDKLLPQTLEHIATLERLEQSA